MYEKRILFLWNNASANTTGGIFHFVRAFLKMSTLLNWKVDVLFDYKSSSKEDGYQELRVLNADVMFAAEGLDSVSNYFSFKPGISAEIISNMQRKIMELSQTRLYDFIIPQPNINLLAPILLNSNMPVLWYTHDSEDLHGNYTGYTDAYRLVRPLINQCFVGTQTQENLDRLKLLGVDSTVLHLPFPDLEVLSKPTVRIEDKKNVLWIGRTEARKQPEYLYKLIEETNLPLTVVTSDKSAIGFKKEFKKRGIVDYEMFIDIRGKQKADIMERSRVFFMPSNNETFGYALAEVMTKTQSVVFNYPWVKPFEKHVHVLDRETKWIEYIHDLYHTNPAVSPNNMVAVQHMQDTAIADWAAFSTKIPQKTNTNFIDKHKNFWLADLAALIDRPFLSIDETSVLYSSHAADKITVTHTDTDSWVSVDKTPADNSKLNSTLGTFTSLFG